MLQNGAVVVAHAVMKFTLLPPEVRTLHPDRQSSGRGCALHLPVLFCSLRSPLTSHTDTHCCLLRRSSTVVMSVIFLSINLFLRATVLQRWTNCHSSWVTVWKCTRCNGRSSPQTPGPFTCGSHLLKVVERRQNYFVASSHETNRCQEFQDQSFSPGKIKHREQECWWS